MSSPPTHHLRPNMANRPQKTKFGAADLIDGLDDLCLTLRERLSNASPTFTPPVRMYIVGGFISVHKFGRRHFTPAIDFWVPDPALRDHVVAAATQVSRKRHFAPTWLDDRWYSAYAGPRMSAEEFERRSLDQGEIIWESRSGELLLYVVDYKWQLTQKLERATQLSNDNDSSNNTTNAEVLDKTLDDASDLLEHLITTEHAGKPYTVQEIKDWFPWTKDAVSPDIWEHFALWYEDVVQRGKGQKGLLLDDEEV